MSIKYNVNFKLNNAVQQVENACSIAIRMMMEDIHTYSTPITPKRPAPVGGNLRTSVSKQMVSPTVGIMTWHAPYAEYQERGYTTGPVVHYSTPGTHAHFVEESVNKVIPRLAEYLKMGGLV